MTTPALKAHYAIVSRYGWWQDQGDWGSPYSAKLYDDPVEALQEISGLGFDDTAHIATVVVERRQ